MSERASKDKELKIIFVIELFSKLSDQEQNMILTQIEALLLRE